MEWNQLQKFLVVAREENFTKAALLLNMTQPSLSQTIKRLETELGCLLFVRDGKKIRLNESGKLFLQTIEEMNILMENTKLKLEEMNNIHHPKVTILFATASKQLPEMLLYLKERNPLTQYQIYQWQRDKDFDDVDIQLLSCTQSENISTTDEVLLNEKILLALPDKHPLLKKEKIYMKDLTQEDFISLNEYWELGRIVKREMDRNLVEPNKTMIVDNPNMLRELLNAQLGIAFVPTLSWDNFGANIVLRQVEGINLSRCIYLRTKQHKYLTVEQKECIEGIKEYFKMKYEH